MTGLAPRPQRLAALVVVVTLTAGLLAAAPPTGPLAPQSDDMALGRARAPVTVIEYASAGCPHCARWSMDVFPAFKAKYVDTGKVRFVLREELAGDAELAAAGFLTARCAGPAKYFDVIDAVFRAQPAIVADGDAYGHLRQVALDAGVGEAGFKACLTDPAELSALQARSDRHVQADNVPSTPTFIIGAAKLEGEQSLADLDRAIAAAGRR